MNESGVPVDWQIEVDNRQTVVPVDAGSIVRAVEQVLRQESCGRAQIHVVLVDDREIRQLNRRFLDHDYATDVISFTYAAVPELEGELIVGAERAQRVADTLPHSWQCELLWYVVHGTLHLLGYEDGDASQRERMRAREGVAMRALGLVWPMEEEAAS